MNKVSPINRDQRTALAARLRGCTRVNEPSKEDRELAAQFLECLTWHGDHYEYIDTDGNTLEVWT